MQWLEFSFHSMIIYREKKTDFHDFDVDRLTNKNFSRTSIAHMNNKTTLNKDAVEDIRFSRDVNWHVYILRIVEIPIVR